MSENLGAALERAGRLFADREAVVVGETRWTYGDLRRRVAGFDAALDELGLAAGDVVGVLGLNSVAHLVAWLGIPRSGRVLNDLNIRLAPAELEFILGDSAARALIVDDAFLEAGRELADACESVEHLIYTGAGELPEGCISLTAMTATGGNPPVAVDPDAIAGIFYTGGTTGLPKGAMLTHRNLVANAKHILIGLRRARRGGVVPVGRRRLCGRRGLPVHRRSRQGHDHLGRGERLLDRGRERDLPAPGMLECAVFGIPHQEWGEHVHAAIVIKPGATASEDELVEHCRARDRRLQVAPVDRLPLRAAAEIRRGQGAKARAPRALLGRTGETGLLTEAHGSGNLDLVRSIVTACDVDGSPHAAALREVQPCDRFTIALVAGSALRPFKAAVPGLVASSDGLWQTPRGLARAGSRSWPPTPGR